MLPGFLGELNTGEQVGEKVGARLLLLGGEEDEFRCVSAHRFACGIAEDAFRRRVPRSDLEVEVPLDDGQRCLLDVERELALGLLARLLCFALRGDVHHRADHPHGHALPVVDDKATVNDVGEGAIATAETVFVRPKFAASLHGCLTSIPHATAVLRMQALHPPVNLRRDRISGVAEHGLHRLIPRDAAGGDVPVPDRVVGGPLEQAVALLHLPQILREPFRLEARARLRPGDAEQQQVQRDAQPKHDGRESFVKTSLEGQRGLHHHQPLAFCHAHTSFTKELRLTLLPAAGGEQRMGRRGLFAIKDFHAQSLIRWRTENPLQQPGQVQHAKHIPAQRRLPLLGRRHRSACEENGLHDHDTW